VPLQLPAVNWLQQKGIISFFMPIRSLKPRRIIDAVLPLLGITLIFLALLGSLLPVQPLFAQSGITSPAAGSAVSGDVTIMGTAVIDPFQKYELHYKMEPSGDDAYIYFFGATTPVLNGTLGTWQAGGLPAGSYSLRLRVVKNDGNYAEFFSPNISVNQGANAVQAQTTITDTDTAGATPTPSEPTPTPIPTATFTPAPQPTAAVGQVNQPAFDAPTPTSTPETVAIINPDNTQALTTTLAEVTNSNNAVDGGSVTRELGEALSLNRLREQFFNGMRISAALFLGVIALYGGKRLFDWVWTQFS
jgi:hypothetical protein